MNKRLPAQLGGGPRVELSRLQARLFKTKIDIQCPRITFPLCLFLSSTWPLLHFFGGIKRAKYSQKSL